MYGIRAIQFLAKGMSNFTQSGYLKNSKHFNQQDTEVDLSDQHILITGANSGIGYSAALQLANKGAKIHLVCRNQERGEQALNKLKQESQKSQDIYLHLCDMSDFASIRQFVQQYKDLGYPIDCLVQNAGAMVHDRQTTKDNLEYNFATNVAGIFLMTELLIPLLEKTFNSNKRNPKVILVSSGGMYTQTLETEDINMAKKKKFDGEAQYAKNKRQQVVLCEKWNQLYTNTKGIQFYSMHPGWTDTIALEKAMPDFHKRFKDNLRNPQQGSDTIYWLACMNSKNLVSGGFYFDRQNVEKHLCLSLTSHKEKEVEKFYNYLLEITKGT